MLGFSLSQRRVCPLIELPFHAAAAGPELTLSIAQVVPCTEAEGPGRRFAIWFQGCPLRCPGCCNPEFLPFHGGESWPISTMLQLIEASQQAHNIEGLSLLGGEPFAHVEGALAVSSHAQQRGLSVMIYSGFTLEQLQARRDPLTEELLRQTDVLVDGPYLRDYPEPTRRWIGSSNQRLHFLTPRYDPSDPCWQHKNTLEVRMTNGEVIINGFPAKAAVGLWKGWRRKPKATN